ncbi:MAG: Ca2+-dependent phosphoinositide-specific phospholipase C [Candidatus Helarchaeota archaeon]
MERKYNKAIFRATHSSYSGGARKSINFQLDSNIRCLEFDIHNGEQHVINSDKFNYSFWLGHNSPEEDVFLGDTNPNTISLENWLEIITDWSKLHPHHEPIALCLDIKENLIDINNGRSLKLLNLLIRDKLNGHIYSPQDHLKSNQGSIHGRDWPTVEELRGKIIVFFTGNHYTKCVYWQEIPLRKQFCFIAYSYEDDGGRNYSTQLLSEVKFVNCHVSYWRWGKSQYQKGKILRLWGFNQYIENLGNFAQLSALNQQGLICNFPATDTPYESWYMTAFPYFC